MRLNIFSFLGKGPSRGSFFFRPFVRRLGARDLRFIEKLRYEQTKCMRAGDLVCIAGGKIALLGPEFLA